MGIPLYSVADGDEDKYESFDVTSDMPWTPRTFMGHVKMSEPKIPLQPNVILQDIPIISDTCTFFDPGDIDQPSYGIPANLKLDTSATLHSQIDPFLDTFSYNHLTGFDEYTDDKLGYTMDKVPKVSRNFNTVAHASTAWHRVMHNDLDPHLLQPYLGFCPVDIIKATLAKTTLLAKMIIRYP